MIPKPRQAEAQKLIYQGLSYSRQICPPFQLQKIPEREIIDDVTLLGDGKALAPATMELNNSEPSALPDSIAISHSPNTRGEERSQGIEDNLEANYESNQNNTGYISPNNAEDRGLVVATLVESDRNIFQTDVIVDAFLVEENPDRENPTPWYKDRRNIVFGIIVIVVASIVGTVTSQLSGDGDIGDDVVDVLQSVAPSTFHSNIPTGAPTLMPTKVRTSAPTLMPTKVRTSAPILSPREVLQLLFDSTNGPSWTNTWDFSSAQSYCDFDGITCDLLDQITEIDLFNNGLRGSIPSEMGMLLALQSLILNFNSITGTIPFEILMLSSLVRLELDVNSITGTIPTEIGMLSSLERLELDFNSITGTIPSEIGMLSSLDWLELINNSITGTIPSEIGMLLSLTSLVLWDNDITGTIPTELCALTNTGIIYDESEISCTCTDSIYIEGTPCN